MFLFGGGGGLTLLLARGGGSTSLGLHMPRFEFLEAWGDIGLGRGPDAENMFSRLGVYGTGSVARRGGGLVSTLVPNCTSKVGTGVAA